MRKLALAVAALLAAGITWQVADAVPPPPVLVVCQRAGADVRSPATNGTCPSGYEKVTVEAPAPVEPTFQTLSPDQLRVDYSVDIPTIQQSSILPFVIAPNGVQISGTLLFESSVGVRTGTITIPDPLAGTYIVGYERVQSSGVSVSPPMQVTVTRGNGRFVRLPDVQALPTNTLRVQASETFPFTSELP